MPNFAKIFAMRKYYWLLIIVLVLPQLLVAQDNITVNQARKDNIISVLNYRFTGGYYSFEKLFTKTVTYPEMARVNCILGIVVVSVTVDCQGNMGEVKIKNQLGYGINEMVSNFIIATEGHWNKCTDTKYTKFEIPIQFRTTGTATDEDAALLVCIGENPGYLCNDDAFYLKKATRYLAKEKGKKAMEILDILIKRNPYETKYYEMKQQAISFN